ncbi:MAG: PDZ domain-containing protein [Acidimicrobiia bacterium]|nr:PDZ domain-containing protein [Acidimicrobiia bacterium]
MSTELGYYRHPTIHGETIVFATEDDLWSVAAEGGMARRLTANPGTVSFPAYSPDGSKIAFTSRDEGHPEAWVMDADGGPATRLTFMGALTQVVGWSPDGSRVIVASDWHQAFRGFMHLHAVPVSGGAPASLDVGPARAISYQPDGSGVVIGRNSWDPARWKRYRGGTAGTLWIDRAGDGTYRPLIKLEANLASPMWIGSRIYFVSDHEGTGNLYSCTPTGRSLTRHTNGEQFYSRFPNTDGHRIAYHAGADLYRFDPESGKSETIPVKVNSSRSQRNRKFVGPNGFVESFELHPEGHTVAASVRGGLYTMPLWEGAPLRHGAISSARYRLAVWLPDGERIAAVTDEGGEESLLVFRADGTGEPTRISGDIGRPDQLEVAPAGSARVALTNQRQQVLLVDLEAGSIKVIAHSPHRRILGLSWSSDGRWLAFGAFVSRRNATVQLYDTLSGQLTEATRPDFVDGYPSFDPEGRYLYFLSLRVFDPVYDNQYFDLGFPKGMRPHLIPLKADAVNPFSAATRAPRPPGASNDEGTKKNGEEKPGNKKDEKPEPTPVEIDLAGITDRVVAFPVPEARYGKVLGAKGRVLFSSYPIEGSLGQDWLAGESQSKGRLESYDFAQEKVETVTEAMSSFSVSLNGQVLAVWAGKKLRVVPVAWKEAEKKPDEPGRESGIVDLGRIRVEVAPVQEWRQMYREAWRLQRDQYWIESMAGIDWTAIHDRYLPLVDRVGSRAEFSDLMWEMQGELGTSHAYELLGDYRPEPGWFQGFLGADLELRGRTWRVSRIPRGDSWDASSASPLMAPGLDIAEGDAILAVDGRPVDGTVSPYERLVDRAGRTVHLTLRRGRRNPRVVAVDALRSEEMLRYRDWVERNRAHVHAETDGRVGYVHVPDMGPWGYAEFHRYFGTEVDRSGLIIDVRQNRGGHVSQLLLEKLVRRRVGYDLTRWGKPESYPNDAPMGPMVALTDEYSGSDGDIFSHAFKLLELGPLIGKRTWGGVIGIFPRHALVDGTITTQPEFSIWFEDVGWGVENYGTDPDIEVDIKPQDYREGRDPQMERAVREVLKLIRTMKPAVPEFELPPSRVAPRLPQE